MKESAAVKKQKVALITGITGQDGSYLSELLLSKNYKVVGLVSKKYNIGWDNISHLRAKLILEEGDLLNKNSLERIFLRYQPAEVYNLAGITFIPTCWEKPVLAFDINALGPLRILEIIRDRYPKTRFFQASSGQIFGYPQESPQTEKTLIAPKDPYAIAKACAHFMVRSFRENYGLFLVNGILYNHESPRRGEEFVTRKITLGAAKIKLGLAENLKLGNLEAQQDWGWAPDYVEAMWLMLQAKKAEDFIIATGKIHSVRDICYLAFKTLGLDYRRYVIRDKILYRQQRGKPLMGNPYKAKKLLGWQPKVTFEEMIQLMTKADCQQLKNKKGKR